MWTAGVVVLIGTWWVTQNIALACCLSCGYYAVALAFGFVLRRILCPVWLYVCIQISIAVCLIVGLFYFSGPKGKNGGSVAREQKAEGIQGKEDKVRDFALKEAPSVWKAYQFLTGAIDDQDKKIAELRKTLEMFGSNVDEDADIRKLLHARNEMAASRDVIKEKLEEAYLQARKFAATPDRTEFDELRKQAVEDGVKEAQAALKRYKAMKEQK